MTNTLLTTDWNADPNSPEVELIVTKSAVTLVFFVNYFIYENFREGDKAKLTFNNCFKYSFNSMNDEGYYMGQYRYKYNDLPWGEFYKIETNWETDFPVKHTTLTEMTDKSKLNHFIFFFKDNTFECVAESYQLEFYSNQ
jgi:hypothetical protein